MKPPPFVTGLTCLRCGSAYPHGNLLTCPACGPEGILDVQVDYAGVASAWKSRPLAGRPTNISRYVELLPVSPDALFPPLEIGWTPVYEVPRLAKAVGVRSLFLKDDGRNPTSSFKDRSSAVGVMKAREFGAATIACASTGNAASSLAGLSAAAGLRSFIFVPERAPEPKIAQLLIFGATVFRVRGSYEDAFDLCTRSCAAFGWYNRNSGMNPFLVEGKKTAGLEIAEQMRDALPDWVAVSVGDGCTIGGIGKGLLEMQRLGIAGRIPRLLGVQAAGAQVMVEAFRLERDVVPSEPDTFADSIAVGTPRNWRRAIAQVRASGGTMITATDEEIAEAMRLTARLGGVFGEPAGVAGVAGLRRAVQTGAVPPDASVLVVITGNGLKDVRSARAAAGKELVIEPRLEAVEAAVRHLGSLSGGNP